MKVQVNDRGQRIGQGHRRAVLTDAEVERLLEDRGPEDAPRMSYTQLARKYRISKSSVRDIVTGRRRGQRGVEVDRPDAKAARQDKVEMRVRVSLKARAIVRRNGGAAWLESIIRMHTAQARDEKGLQR